MQQSSWNSNKRNLFWKASQKIPRSKKKIKLHIAHFLLLFETKIFYENTKRNLNTLRVLFDLEFLRLLIWAQNFWETWFLQTLEGTHFKFIFSASLQPYKWKSRFTGKSRSTTLEKFPCKDKQINKFRFKKQQRILMVMRNFLPFLISYSFSVNEMKAFSVSI